VLPTLNGRIQTRVFVLIVIGGLWSLVIGPLLPGGGTTGDKLKAMYGVLLIVTVLGVLWELLYHGLMQFRWEKDWPTLFGLLTGIPEGLVAFAVARSGVVDSTEGISGSAFLVGFGTTWLVTWLWVNGPMRVFTVHWRFRGGRLL
jgi:ABC-type arginine/histidine transport system permease subunit